MGKIKTELKKLADPEKAKLLQKYFKTGKGQYGEGDKFLGIVMPKLREVAKKYAGRISIEETLKILQSKFHEERMLALLILMFKYREANKRKNEIEKKKIFSAYLKNSKFINNWDLVDVTCRDIVGAYLLNKERKILYKLAKSKNIWERRIAIISTFYFMQRGDLVDCFKLAKILLDPTLPRLRGTSKHNLIHKAVGWMLREAGKRDKLQLIKFLETNGPKMPRTTLRYAIERFSPAERKKFLAKF